MKVMARELTQRELQNECGEIMRELDRGHSFVVTRNGVPVGEFTPLRRHRFVAADAVVEMFRVAPSVDASRFLVDLDQFSSQEPNARR